MVSVKQRREQNEKKFSDWRNLSEGGRNIGLRSKENQDMQPGMSKK